MDLLTFEPIAKSMPWGGARLPGFLSVPLSTPGGGPVGEAWVLSDVEGNASRVAHGPQRGRTLRELIAAFPRELFGEAEHESPSGHRSIKAPLGWAAGNEHAIQGARQPAARIDGRGQQQPAIPPRAAADFRRERLG